MLDGQRNTTYEDIWQIYPPSPIFQRFLEKAFPRMVALGQHLHKGAVGALAEEMAEHGCAGTLGPDVAT